MADRDPQAPNDAPRPSFAERLARAQLEGPWRFVAAAFLLGLAALPVIIGVPGLTDGLTLNSDFTALLPRSAPSVRDMDEIQLRAPLEAAPGDTLPVQVILVGDLEALDGPHLMADEDDLHRQRVAGRRFEGRAQLQLVIDGHALAEEDRDHDREDRERRCDPDHPVERGGFASHGRKDGML